MYWSHEPSAQSRTVELEIPVRFPEPALHRLEGRRRTGCGCSALNLLVLSLFLLTVMVALSQPCRLPRARAHLLACQSNLKKLGAAVEMCASDPGRQLASVSKAELTPLYLQAIPECPSAGTDTYRVVSLGWGGYLVSCQGENHPTVSRKQCVLLGWPR